jgi:hypothetical protein
MEYQLLFNIVFGLLISIGGYMWKTSAERMSELERNLHEHHADFLTRFAHKEETIRMLDEIKVMLRDISTKIDTKQDKQHRD